MIDWGITYLAKLGWGEVNNHGLARLGRKVHGRRRHVVRLGRALSDVDQSKREADRRHRQR